VKPESPSGPEDLGKLVVREGGEPGKIRKFTGPLAPERAPEIGYKNLRACKGHPTSKINRGIPKPRAFGLNRNNEEEPRSP